MFYTDKTWVFDQSERALDPIYIIILSKWLKQWHVVYNYMVHSLSHPKITYKKPLPFRRRQKLVCIY